MNMFYDDNKKLSIYKIWDLINNFNQKYVNISQEYIQSNKNMLKNMLKNNKIEHYVTEFNIVYK